MLSGKWNGTMEDRGDSNFVDHVWGQCVNMFTRLIVSQLSSVCETKGLLTPFVSHLNLYVSYTKHFCFRGVSLFVCVCVCVFLKYGATTENHLTSVSRIKVQGTHRLFIHVL